MDNIFLLNASQKCKNWILDNFFANFVFKIFAFGLVTVNVQDVVDWGNDEAVREK
jgi:hypothetical protein